MKYILLSIVLLMVVSGCSTSSSQTTPPRNSFASKLGMAFLDLALPSEFNELVGLPKENQSVGRPLVQQRPLMQHQSHGQTVYDEDECIGPVVKIVVMAPSCQRAAIVRNVTVNG